MSCKPARDRQQKVKEEGQAHQQPKWGAQLHRRDKARERSRVAVRHLFERFGGLGLSAQAALPLRDSPAPSQVEGAAFPGWELQRREEGLWFLLSLFVEENCFWKIGSFVDLTLSPLFVGRLNKELVRAFVPSRPAASRTRQSTQPLCGEPGDAGAAGRYPLQELRPLPGHLTLNLSSNTEKLPLVIREALPGWEI